jgi:4-diphosphocytidyl-2-C-methyl-D-erythritol kinase
LPASLAENAPAKVNLTLRVLGRRGDGYHEIESLVAFADFGDRLDFAPGGALSLTVGGPDAAQAGADDDNLVLKASRALAERVPGLKAGAFRLEKNLPVAAGLGGGSSDAAAALRLLARANGLSSDDARLYAAARATGADVPVCLDPWSRLMRGIVEILSGPLALPPLPALLVNPGVALATKLVFAGWTPAREAVVPLDIAGLAKIKSAEQLVACLDAQANDLEGAAIKLAPVVGNVLVALRALAGCRLARMSGSGSTCFGLFPSAGETSAAAKILRRKYPGWWVCETKLG